MCSRSSGYKNINNVTITFQINYDVDNSDTVGLAVSGSTPELGSWEVAKCIIADEIPKGSGKWSVSVQMSPEQHFFWKWVVISRDRSRVIRWEHIKNREHSIARESRTIYADFEGPALILPQVQSR